MVQIQFVSTKFTGSESSAEILVSIVALGAVSIDDITITINLNEGTAKG